jgi:hypothetical protein
MPESINHKQLNDLKDHWRGNLILIKRIQINDFNSNSNKLMEESNNYLQKERKGHEEAHWYPTRIFSVSMTEKSTFFLVKWVDSIRCCVSRPPSSVLKRNSKFPENESNPGTNDFTIKCF